MESVLNGNDEKSNIRHNHCEFRDQHKNLGDGLVVIDKWVHELKEEEFQKIDETNFCLRLFTLVMKVHEVITSTDINGLVII